MAPVAPAAVRSSAGPVVAVPPALDDAGPTEAAAGAGRPDPAAAEEAQVRAAGFLRAFARTDLEQGPWWQAVAGYLTPAAAEVYRSTDVANVPVHTVTEGSARLAGGSTRYVAVVTVDTDVGRYDVTLVRAGGAWLIDRAVPVP